MSSVTVSVSVSHFVVQADSLYQPSKRFLSAVGFGNCEFVNFPPFAILTEAGAAPTPCTLNVTVKKRVAGAISISGDVFCHFA